MNKIYKVIYNKNKHRYEVVSELAKSHGGKCKTTVATAGDTSWLRRLWMRVRGGANKSDEDGNPVTMSISRAAMAALMCISVWSAAAVSSSWVEAASTEGVPVSVKYDETTGTIKIVKTDPDTNVETILATYAVGGKIASITGDTKSQYPTNTIALGENSTVLQSNTIAIGTDAHAGDAGDAGGSTTQGDGKIAIGTKTVTSGDRSIALGNKSTTNNGSYNIVQGNDSIGIGTSTSVFGYSGVSIGRRNIIGVPNPGLVKDGVLTTKSRTKYGEGDPGGNSVIVGAYNVAYGSRSSIIGTYSRAMGSNSVAIGSGVQSLSDGSIAIGKGSGYEFEDGSRKKTRDKEYYGRDWELPPEYKVLKQVLSNDIAGDEQYKGTGRGIKWENGGTLPKYNNYGAGSSDPGGFIVEGKNALGIGTYTQVRGDSAIGLATGEMTADLSDKDKSAYAKDMRKIMDMEETLYDAKEALQAGTGDTATLKSAVKAAEESLSAAKKAFRETYLTKYSFVDGDGALGVGRQILAQGDRSMAVGDFAKAISSDAIAYGGQTLANGINSMAIGGKAHVGTTDTSFDNSMAIGSHTNVQAGNAVALGAFSEVTGQNSLALGFGKQSGDTITYNSVSGKDSTLIGSYGNIVGSNSILIGSNGNIANDRVVGLGNNINIEAADPNDQENNTAGSVFLGDHAGYVKDSKRSRSLGQVDVVGSAGKMELTESLSSTKGALRDYTKDFIYIYMLERQDDGTQIGAPIAVRSDFAGGDSTVGVVSVGSTYQQQFNSLKEIKDYHSKVGSLITVPVDVTVQVTKNGVPLGKQQQTRYFAADSTRDTIYADNTLSEEDKAKVWDTIQKSISSSNTTYTIFETRRIQNVAPGLIGLNSTDAINGSQLFATNQMLGNLVGSLKKTLGDNVTVTEDGEITVASDIKTLGWIAKADTVDGSNGKVAYDVDKEKGETEEAYQARKAKLEKDGYIVDASKVMTFKAGKNIELVQKPGEFSISTIDTPSFKSVELRGETKEVNGSQETPVTMMDSNGMQVYTETVTPDGDGTTTTKKVSTTVNNEGVTTDGTVKVTNGEDGGKDLVSLGKGSATTGETDQDFGTIHVDGKQGADGTITIDRGTKSLTDTANVGKDREKKIGADNPVAGMDRITYTTKGPNDSTINHEVATLDDGFFLTTSKDVTENKAAAKVKLNNTIKFTDGANTKVSTVESKDGVHSLHIDVNGLPVVYTDKDGNKLTKVGDKFYKDDQFDNGTLKPNATPSEAKNISIVNPDGSISKTDGSAPTTVNNVGSSIGGDVNNGAPKGSTINGEPGNN
ncbi:ESPR-type extended signal peptide-containing protein, partial [Veillonella magna]